MVKISVEGNIGVGKTSLLCNLKKETDYKIVFESIEDWRDYQGTNVLELMYNHPQRWTFYFQSLVQLSFLKSQVESEKSVTIFERNFQSVNQVFVRHALHQRNISSVEANLLLDWVKTLNEKFNLEIHHFIYLRLSPEKTLERITKRNRSEESNISLSLVQQLSVLHDKWLLSLPNCFVIDASKDESTILKEVLEIIEKVSKKSIKRANSPLRMKVVKENETNKKMKKPNE